MSSLQKEVDFLVVGAGILGLSVAYQLTIKFPNAKITILEKELGIGMHASGRNSGVVHAGIYYEPNSMKARFCRSGSIALKDFCSANNIPFNKIGKIIIPTKESEEYQLSTLYDRAKINGAEVHIIDEKQLKEIEPEARTATGKALFSPNTGVVDPKNILDCLERILLMKGVMIEKDTRLLSADKKRKLVITNKNSYSYGYLYNTCGAYSDIVSKYFGVDDRYVLIPFRGTYYELSNNSKVKINHLIYPVPDPDVPFLGVHYTKALNGKVYLGPSAIPAFGRENYSGINGISVKEGVETILLLSRQYLFDYKRNFRNYAHQEITRFLKARFTKAVQKLTPKITINDLVKSSKVGIRGQLYDKKSRELVMDFVLSKTNREIHVLNAASPAFTCALSFSEYIVESSEV